MEGKHKRRKNRPAKHAKHAKRRVRLDGDVCQQKEELKKERSRERVNLRRQIIPTVKSYGGLYNSNTNVMRVTTNCNLS